MTDIDEVFILAALELAGEAEKAGEVPVGAVVVRGDAIIGRGMNTRENGGGISGHAEINALNDACGATGDWRLSGCTLYVTLEPCLMCAGAIVAARIGRVVYGAPDKSAGAFGGAFDVRSELPDSTLEICRADGEAADQCSSRLKAFFAGRRRENEEIITSRRLGREFFRQTADTAAPAMLGKLLCRRLDDGKVIRVRVTETECYLGTEDTACHAHKGKTDRNRIMWDRGGKAYVYLCYGMHCLLNIVTGNTGEPQAVLIRGVEGASGPGRVTKSISVDRRYNGADLVFSDEIWMEDDGFVPAQTEMLPRVGIDYAEKADRERLWRFRYN